MYQCSGILLNNKFRNKFNNLHRLDFPPYSYTKNMHNKKYIKLDKTYKYSEIKK